mmetsp:Transcript_46736/g.93043  ORF Transcript_46736/g.93043 Transcript_46736/m.93043 type:complete len:266 (+) Transcript_46736:66-863(+)
MLENKPSTLLLASGLDEGAGASKTICSWLGLSKSSSALMPRDVKLHQTALVELEFNTETCLDQLELQTPNFLKEAPMFPRYTAYLSSHVFLGLAMIALVKALPFYLVFGQTLQYVLSLLCWSMSSAQITNVDRACALTNISILVVFYLNQGISAGTISRTLALTVGFKVLDYVYYPGPPCEARDDYVHNRPHSKTRDVTSWYLLWHFNLGCNNALFMTLKQPLPWAILLSQYLMAFVLPLLMSRTGADNVPKESAPCGISVQICD